MAESSSGKLKAAKTDAKKHTSGVRAHVKLDPLELGKREGVSPRPAVEAAAEEIGGDMTPQELELLLRGHTFQDE